MRKVQGHEIVIGALVATAFWALIYVLTSNAASHYEVCETAKEGAKECAHYNIVSLAFRKIVSSIDVLSALITSIATIFIARFTFTLKRSTDNLWEAGERQLTATRRPWVKVDSIQPIGDLIFENGEGRINLFIIVSNKGNSPGLRVRVNVKLVASNKISLLEEQQTFAASFRRAPVQNELRPELTSWPGDTIGFQVTAWLSSIDMPRFKPLADNTPFPITLLAVVGCVDYEFSFAPGHHQTGIIFDLRKKTLYPRSRFGSIYTEVEGAVMLEDGIISKDDLSLSIGLVGTGPVD